MRRLVLGLGFLLVWGSPAGGQDLARRIGGAPDGVVRLSFAARDGVCGNGRNIQTHRSRSGEWESDCEPGPVRVALDMRAGHPTAIRTYIGGRWSAETDRVTDLGLVSAQEAGGWFLDLAERGAGGGLKGDPILPAVVADSAVTWPALLRIARTTYIRKEVRRQAVFWLGQEAADAATRGLEALAEDENEDREIRRQAVFALSQLDRSRGVATLIRVAREDRDPAIRKQAMFWLGQSEDPRALALFEEVLTRQARRP